MDFKPQTFFMGVVDFFSVLLPGAMFTWFVKVMFYDKNISFQTFFKMPESEAGQWLAFIIIAYITGNLLFVFSSLIVDAVYDPYLRKLVRPKYKIDLEVKTASEIRNNFLDTDEWILKLYERNNLTTQEVRDIYSKSYREIINPFKWCQYYLLYNNQEALSEVKKTEADSKFFRSLVLTFFIMFITAPDSKNYTVWVALFLSGLCIYLFISMRNNRVLKKNPIVLPILSFVFFVVFIFLSWPIQNVRWLFLILSVLALYLFASLRYKSTIKAYEFVISHYHQQLQKTSAVVYDSIKSSIIKSELTKDFLERHGRRINFLSKGFINVPRQVVIKTGELQNTFFSSDQYEWWYCMEGKGMMIVRDGDDEKIHFLQQNAALPMAKGKKYSFQNKQKDLLELVVINQ